MSVKFYLKDLMHMPIFFDGAFGTYYYDLTNDNSPCEMANITNPNIVLSIHKEYIRAGVRHIKTNTFNANLSVYGDFDMVKKIVTRGYEIACKATEGTSATVFADIGYIYPGDEQDAASQYKEIAEIFISLGATRFLFETFREYEILLPTVRIIREKIPNAVVITSFAVSQDGYTTKGHYYRNLLEAAAANIGIDIVGLNCVCGPTHLLSLVKDLGHLSKPLSVMPNSGYPSSVNGRTVFEDNAGYFARRINEIFLEGATVLGGCCGTTPKHIDLAIREINKKNSPSHKTVRATALSMDAQAKRLALKPLAVELDPPPDSDCSFLLNAVDSLKKCGVSTITFADSPLAKARADSIMTAARIKREKFIDVLPHLTCRDKNHIAIKGSLLGASFDGINRLLVVTGDPEVLDNHKKRGVYSFNSIELISYIKSLNTELFAANPFTLGGALNINARNFDSELARCRKKIEKGADFLFTQPIFTNEAVGNFILAKKELDCEIFAGILPLVSYKNAVFLNNEVSGINIPENVMAQLANKSRSEAYRISIDFTGTIINSVYDYADGFYIMTPLKKVELVCGLIKRCFDVQR